jgi:hypothetical protein
MGSMALEEWLNYHCSDEARIDYSQGVSAIDGGGW